MGHSPPDTQSLGPSGLEWDGENAGDDDNVKPVESQWRANEEPLERIPEPIQSQHSVHRGSRYTH
jgi:hypothetical protein